MPKDVNESSMPTEEDDSARHCLIHSAFGCVGSSQSQTGNEVERYTIKPRSTINSLDFTQDHGSFYSPSFSPRTLEPIGAGPEKSVPLQPVVSEADVMRSKLLKAGINPDKIPAGMIAELDYSRKQEE